LTRGLSLGRTNRTREDLPVESRLLQVVTVRLVASEAGPERHDGLLEQERHLGNAAAVGRVLRWVAGRHGEKKAMGSRLNS
jgi:hypothetical protein